VVLPSLGFVVRAFACLRLLVMRRSPSASVHEFAGSATQVPAVTISGGKAADRA
jgi:hypothetical protein